MKRATLALPRPLDLTQSQVVTTIMSSTHSRDGGFSHVGTWSAFVPRKRVGLPAKSDNGGSTIGC